MYLFLFIKLSQVSVLRETTDYLQNVAWSQAVTEYLFRVSLIVLTFELAGMFMRMHWPD